MNFATILAVMIVGLTAFMFGYACGEKDANMDWLQKEEYYRWFLEMKKHDKLDGKLDEEKKGIFKKKK